jgi:hypothetical protein
VAQVGERQARHDDAGRQDERQREHGVHEGRTFANA